MRKVKVEGGDERQILIGMITDPIVLGRIALRWDRHLFRSDWANQIGQLCIEYFGRHQKAPGRHLETLVRHWVGKRKDDDPLVQMIHRFLSGLSEEYQHQKKESNPEFLIDLAGKHFTKVRAERLVDEMQGHLDVGQTDKIDVVLQKYSRVELGAGSFVDVLQDREAMRAAIEEVAEPLLVYPGALGDFFGNCFCRDAFVAFTGPEKRGKTFWLIDVAWRAMKQRRRVAFFAVGDMSQTQMMHRFVERACGRPLRPKSYDYPVKITFDPEDKQAIAEVTHRRRKSPGLRTAVARKKMDEAQQQLRSEHSFLKLACFPNDSITVQGIREQVQVLERAGWVPDVIVIDYADILAPPPGVSEFRHQQNKTWQQLRALSQERHCLVVTATQSDAKSYKDRVITRSNFSEDKRKQAHVTGLIGLNQTPAEKDAGVMRLNWVVRRDASFSEWKCVHVATCMEIANPAVKSCD